MLGFLYSIPALQGICMLIVTFDEFETHAGVVVRTFPETRLIILLVHRTIFQDSPVPLTVLGIQQMLGYIVPAGDGNQKILFGAEILVEVDMADDVLTLHPPLALQIELIAILPMLINHTAIWTQTFISSLSNTADEALNLMKHLLITQYEGGLME